MLNEILNILQENNRLLQEIKALLLRQYNEEYIAQQDMKAFNINVAADIFVEMLEKNKELKTKIQHNFHN
ncbi:MAG: hypothetical protein K2G70_05870 [Turicibacter sp.]|nr:hypothetical protein [Turicibacter sp.]